MPYFRARILEKNVRQDTNWGNDNIIIEGAPVTCRLNIVQAKDGLAEARRTYPAKRYHIQRYEDGEPDQCT